MEQNSADIIKWLQVRHSDGVGPVIFRRLLEYFCNIDSILISEQLTGGI